jgi:DNA-binding protein HU-beta
MNTKEEQTQMATEHIVGKGELVHQIAARSGLSLKDAEKALDAFTEVVPENLARGKEVRLIGFGSWKLRAIAARKVKSIRTGKDVSLPAHKRVGFSAGTTLAQAAEAPKGKSSTAAKKR